MRNKNVAKAIKKLLIVQVVIVILLTLILLATRGYQDALSSFLGGLVANVPAMIFATKMFQYQGAHAARQIVKSFYVGEALKLFSTIALFVLVFKWFKINSLVFFMTYIAVVLSHWFSPLFLTNRNNRQESD